MHSYLVETDKQKTQIDTFYSKSLVTSALPTTVLQNVAEYWMTTAKSVRRNWYIMVDMYGGPNSTITREGAADSASFAYRDPDQHLFLYQFYDAIGFGTYPSTGFAFLEDWVQTFTDGLDAEKAPWGMYINYADPRMERARAQDVYYRESLPRLRELRARFDPGELFYYPQAVEPAGVEG